MAVSVKSKFLNRCVLRESDFGILHCFKTHSSNSFSICNFLFTVVWLLWAKLFKLYLGLTVTGKFHQTRKYSHCFGTEYKMVLYWDYTFWLWTLTLEFKKASVEAKQTCSSQEALDCYLELFRLTRFRTQKWHHTIWPWTDFADWSNLGACSFHVTVRLRTRVNSTLLRCPLLKAVERGGADACLIASRDTFMGSKKRHITYLLWPAWWWQRQLAPSPLKLCRETHGHVCVSEVMHTLQRLKTHPDL